MVQFLFVLLPPPICPTYRHGVTPPDASGITSIFPVGIRGRNTVNGLTKQPALVLRPLFGSCFGSGARAVPKTLLIASSSEAAWS